MDFSLRGILPAMLTPLHEDETINTEGIADLTEHVLSGGVHGLFVLGTHGEAYALTVGEREAVTAGYVEAAAGRVPVFAGVGGVTTRASLANLRAAENGGADGVSVITPSFISPGQEELYAHFRAIAEATQLPVLLYNLPSRTHLNIEPATLVRLAEIDNIVGVKDSSGDLTNTMEYLRLTPDGFAVMNGSDALICAGLSAGACGAVAATANVVPELVVRIYERFEAGDLEGAWNAQMELIPLRRCFPLSTVPDPVKEAARAIGLPVGPTMRPAGPMSDEGKRKLRGVLADMGLRMVGQ